jgi:hypothetical protein
MPNQQQICSTKFPPVEQMKKQWTVGGYEALAWLFRQKHTRSGRERESEKKESSFLGKGKFVSVFNELSTSHEDLWESGCIDPRFPDLGTVEGE